MKRLPALLIGAAFAAPMFFPLRAQTAVLRTLMDRDAASAPPPATLCILDARGAHALADGFAALLQTGDLKVYQVPVRAFTPGSAAEKAFAARHPLPAAPQWLLVDARTDAVLARGAQLPTAAAFAQDLEQAGFRDRAKELRAYLKRNPQVIEARAQLLDLLRKRGEAAARHGMGIEVPSSRDRLERGDLVGVLQAGDDPGLADLSRAKKLSPIQDLEAWSAFAQEFDSVFRDGSWREMDLAWTREGQPLDAASPTLQGLYLRWLPAVEAALREEPGSGGLWSLWIWMSQALGGRPLRPLLDSMSPSPLTPGSDWPPAPVARQLLATARTPADWRGLKEHYQALWEDEPHTLRDTPGTDTLLFERDWDQCLGPLLECCLHSGDTAQADALLRGALDASRWGDLAAKGAALATRCGQPAMAARWSALRRERAR